MEKLEHDYKDSYKSCNWSELLPYVYVIEAKDTGLYKIGYTNRLKSRLNQLQTGCPYKIKLIMASPRKNAREMEAVLHRKFNDNNIRGEWFDLYKDDLESINDILFGDIDLPDVITQREYVECVS